MDNFIFKFNSIFDYDGQNNIFQTFKEETLQFLNNKNLRIVDYKSIGSIFGMNYNQENVKNTDILIELNYDFYIIKKFVSEIIHFYCSRNRLTTKKYEEIIESYALDNYDLIKVINKTNERKKFKLLQKKIWIPLNNSIQAYKEKIINTIKVENVKVENVKVEYKKKADDNCDINICEEINDNKRNKIRDMDDTWVSVNGKKKTLKVNLMECYGENTKTNNVENLGLRLNTEVEINVTNRFNTLIEEEEEEDEDEGYDPEDKKRFGDFQIFNKHNVHDMELCNKQYDKLSNSEQKIEKIISNIEKEIVNKKKIAWADIIDDDYMDNIDN